MNYSDEAFVTMLLTLALSPDREEYAYPLNASEFVRIKGKVRDSELSNVGKLIEMDISGLMMQLDLSEGDAYRIYTLLHRDVQLEYAIENLLAEGIEIETACNSGYPKRLIDKASYGVLPVYYRTGNPGLLSKPLLAVVGIGGVRTSPEDRRNAETLVREGVRHGYTMLTGGEPGISRVVLDTVLETGGTLVEVLAGGMSSHIKENRLSDLIGLDRAAVISMEHPDAEFSIPRVGMRNRVMFSLAETAFIFNTDGMRNEAEALRNRLCSWIYASKFCRQNETLISRGAVPFDTITPESFNEMSRHWIRSRSEQINIFDIFGSI